MGYTKKQSQVHHFKTRMKERIGLDINNYNIQEIISYIKNGRITLEFKEMFLSVKTENAEKDIDIISSKINNILEKKIMEIPEQWSFWYRVYYSKPIRTISNMNKR